MKPNNLTQLLIGYGLTKNQAKILTTLNQTNTSLNVKQISQNSNIPRESIYNILHNLQKKALIEKIITKPEKYQTIPLKRILTLLHEQKTNQIHKLEELTTQTLIDNNHKPEKNNQKNGPQFVLIPKKKQLINKIDHAITNSTKNIKIITSWKRYLKALVIYKTALATALSKGTKILILVYEKSSEDSESKDDVIFREQPNTLIRYVDGASEVIEVIVVDQEVFLMTKPKLALEESPALWSTNKSLVVALRICFDSVWEKA